MNRKKRKKVKIKLQSLRQNSYFLAKTILGFTDMLTVRETLSQPPQNSFSPK